MSATISDPSPDAALIAAENEFGELLTGYDHVTDWVSVESAALVRRLDEVKDRIMRTPPQTLAGAGVKLRFLLEMLQRDWDDYFSESVGEPAGAAWRRHDVPMLRQVIALLEREAQS